MGVFNLQVALTSIWTLVLAQSPYFNAFPAEATLAAYLIMINIERTYTLDWIIKDHETDTT